MLFVDSLLTGLLTTLIVYFLCFRWRRRRMYELADKIPGPVGLPLIGIALEALGKDSKGKMC